MSLSVPISIANCKFFFCIALCITVPEVSALWATKIPPVVLAIAEGVSDIAIRPAMKSIMDIVAEIYTRVQRDLDNVVPGSVEPSPYQWVSYKVLDNNKTTEFR